MVKAGAIFSYNSSNNEEKKLCVVTYVQLTDNCAHFSVLFDEGFAQVYSCLREDVEKDNDVKLLEQELNGKFVSQSETLIGALETVFRNGNAVLNEV